jgi:transposase
MDQETLFDVPVAEGPQATAEEGAGQPRMRCANRRQREWTPCCLDELLPEDHRARVVWEFVQGLNLQPLYQSIRAVEGHAGRPPCDPKILVALWLYATLEGVGSARQLDRLCKEHVAYRWICGGVPMNYHTLSDFRTQHGEVLDQLLTQSVATLMHEGLVTLEKVAQDGVRVRAGAGGSSFHRRGTLEQCLAEAEAQVKALRKELEEDPTRSNRRQQKARERAARERAERVAQALQNLNDVEKKKQSRGGDSLKYPARASTTDPEARKMKMPDGGFRPAYNAQFATDADSQVIVGVEVTNSGSDGGQMQPMVEQIEERCGQRPEKMLVDGGFVTVDDIDEAERNGTEVYAPVKDEEKQREAGKDPFAPHKGDTPAVVGWRQRMANQESRQMYRLRGATAECVNAIARNRGLQQFRVRGSPKVRAVLLWFALAHNLMRTVALRAAAAEKVR